MDIRILNGEEYELSKALWLECFPEDGEAFVSRYYSERSKPEFVLGAFRGGSSEPVSMLHMIPVEMRFGGKAYPVCLVSGVCTKPGFRRRGLCAALFEEAFPIMRERGFAATVLQPFRPSFYAKFGYRTFIYRKSVTLSYARPNCFVRPSETIAPDPKRMAELYASFTARFSGCTVRDESCFEGFIREFSEPEARLVMTEYGVCAGYVEDGEGNTFRAFELFYLEGTDPASLLPAGFEKCVFPLPEGERIPCGAIAEDEPFSMLMPLSDDFEAGNGPFYGFDRY